MGAIKTLFLITITTARMIFPDVPAFGPPNGNAESNQAVPAVKSITIDLLLDKALDKSAKAEVFLPEGLKMGKSAKLNFIDLAKSRAESDPVSDKEPKPKWILRTYWGSGDTIAEGQPKSVEFDGDLANVTQCGTENNKQKAPDKYYGYWPSMDNIEVSTDASALGKYTLSSTFLSPITVSITPEQDFLPPIELIDFPKNPDLAKPLKITWKPIPGAIGYILFADGGDDKEMVTWTSSSDPTISRDIEFKPVNQQDIKKYLEKKIIISPEENACTIPASIFKGKSGVILNITAIGRDIIQEKDGIATQVVVRSTSSIPLAPVATPPPPPTITPTNP